MCGLPREARTDLKLELSVVICTNNTRPDCLRQVLESLMRQTVPRGRWELLIVDNGSELPSGNESIHSWHPNARRVREAEVGLLPARLRGFAESTGELCLYFDDDTVVDPTYLERALSIAAAHPHLGMFGAGTVKLECATAFPAETAPFLPLFGIREIDAPRWTNNPDDQTCRPHGAGLCLNRIVGEAYLRLARESGAIDVIGRHGNRLFAGEDDLCAYAASFVGAGFGVFPELRLKHLVPAERLHPEAVVRLIHDHTFSHALLAYILSGRKPARYGIERRLRNLAKGLRRGVFTMKCGDAAARGEADAARFIELRRLQPIESEMFQRIEARVPRDRRIRATAALIGEAVIVVCALETTTRWVSPLLLA